jgi:hypothetical protein
MNLRELLLQFAGENEESLQLDELITNNINGVEVERDVGNGVKILVKNPINIEKIKVAIKNLLEKAGYEEYSITPMSEGNTQHIVVSIE